jgi:hypothetical protein
VWGPGLVVPLWPPRALPGAPAAPGRRSGRSGGPALWRFLPAFRRASALSGRLGALGAIDVGFRQESRRDWIVDPRMAKITAL